MKIESRGSSVEINPFKGYLSEPLLQEALEPEYVRGLLGPVFTNSSWTFNHSVGVARVISDLYDVLDLPHDAKVVGQRGALLHDIGKVNNPAIPSTVLDANRKLTEEEFSGIQTHPRVGFERIVIYDLYVANIVVAHHEFQGDRSYPRHTISPHEERREKIHPELLRDQQLLALADTVEALFDNRPYKPAWSPERVGVELTRKFSEIFSSEFLDTAVKVGSDRARN